MENLIFIKSMVTLAISAFLWMLVKEEKIYGAEVSAPSKSGH